MRAASWLLVLAAPLATWVGSRAYITDGRSRRRWDPPWDFTPVLEITLGWGSWLVCCGAMLVLVWALIERQLDPLWLAVLAPLAGVSAFAGVLWRMLTTPTTIGAPLGEAVAQFLYLPTAILAVAMALVAAIAAVKLRLVRSTPWSGKAATPGPTSLDAGPTVA